MLPSKLPEISLFGTSVIYAISLKPLIVNPVLFILKPAGFILNLLPKQSSYCANWFKSAFKSLLIITFVILDVIPLSIRSIRVLTLLYLNLPPNLFNSTFSAYWFNAAIIEVLKLDDDAICDGL